MRPIKALRVCRICFKIIRIREGSKIARKPICRVCENDVKQMDSGALQTRG